MEQRSKAWYIERTGKLGGSENKDIVDLRKKLKLKARATVMTAVYKVVSEVLTGQREESFTNAAMQWGIDNEDENLEPYVTEDCTFPGGITRDDLKYCWFSPDMLALKDGFTVTDGYEAKCPTSKTFIKYVERNEVPSEHLAQLIDYFVMVPTLNTLTLEVFDPRVKGKNRFTCILKREDYLEEIDNLEESMIEFCSMVDETLKLFKKDVEDVEV